METRYLVVATEPMVAAPKSRTATMGSNPLAPESAPMPPSVPASPRPPCGARRKRQLGPVRTQRSAELDVEGVADTDDVGRLDGRQAMVGGCDVTALEVNQPGPPPASVNAAEVEWVRTTEK